MKYSIFKALSDNEINEIMPYFQKEHIKAGKYIVKEGEYSDMAFLLEEGEVSVIKETIYKDDSIITDIKAKGDEFFGEVNLIDRGLVTSTIMAKKDCEILKITHSDFVNLIEEKPTIGVKLLWIISYDLAGFLRKADRDVITLFNAFVEVVEND